MCDDLLVVKIQSTVMNFEGKNSFRNSNWFLNYFIVCEKNRNLEH